MSLPFYRYIILDGNKYPISQGSYLRKWVRIYQQNMHAGAVRVNFIDRGPGIRVYDMTIILQTWATGSLPYKDGITGTWDTQLANLETTWAKIATPVQFVDPFGQSPGPASNYGVFFTSFNLTIPQYSTPEKSFVLAQIEVTEATQLYN